MRCLRTPSSLRVKHIAFLQSVTPVQTNTSGNSKRCLVATVIVGHQSQLPNVGDYLTTELAGVPLVAIRSEIDTISVFVNACRHRGAKLLTAERGQCKTRLICPYHAWSYDRAGHLVGVPKESSFGELDKSALGLREVHTELRHGFIWVTLTPSSQVLSVADHLGAAIIMTWQA